MLVLSRKTGQQIHIGPDITISILEIGGKFVRIGIDAPESVCILRGEVKIQIEQENRLAASHARDVEGLRGIGSLLGFLSPRRNREDDGGGPSAGEGSVRDR